MGKVRGIGEKALAELREANVQELGSLALRHAEAMEARRSALEQAQEEVRTLREEAGRRAAEADESWQRRIAEADARGAAGIDLATRAQVDSQRTKAALQACRQELQEERVVLEELRTR